MRPGSRRSSRLRPPRHALSLGICALLAGGPPAGADPPPDLFLQQVVSGLTEPVDVRHAGDASERLFIVEQDGRIKIFDGTQLLPTPFLNISALLATGGERGLLGLAFHPDYRTNGLFYVNYTEPESDKPADCPSGAQCAWNTVVARYQVSAQDADVADPSSALRLIVINQDYGNHNGGGIAFGPDGYLYVGMGDGGSGGDPNNRAQDLTTLLGKMLRIDVDSGAPGAPDCGLVGNYTVPADNPFRDGQDGDCDEIWALGLRNPWRWSFDRFTGDLLVGDVGQSAIEEIDYEPWATGGGINYGWRCYEGSNPYNTSGCGASGLYTFPVLEYGHDLGCSVTGGYLYRGPTIAGLQGTYIYGDYCSGRIWFATRSEEGGWTTTQWQNTTLNISAFGEDEKGEIYVADLNGTIYRIVSPSSVFADGFESGDLAVWSRAVP